MMLFFKSWDTSICKTLNVREIESNSFFKRKEVVIKKKRRNVIESIYPVNSP